jgi:hypothetical protein
MPTQEEIKALFEATKTAFQQSAIRKYAEANNEEWNYAITSTQLTPNSTVIVGFNWGVTAEDEYEPQTEIPDDTFKDLYDKKWLGSLERSYQPLKKYLPDEDIDHCVQTNFCFFRSESEAQIRAVDLALTTPLFSRLMELIEPKQIIGFSHHLRKYLARHYLLLEMKQTRIPMGKRSVYAIKGIYQIKKREVPFYILPYPNSRISGEARSAAWAL